MKRNRSLLDAARVAFLLLALVLSACGTAGPQATVPPGSAAVDVIYLNHPPVRPVLDQVNAVLESYGPMVIVHRYDFDSPDGQAFAQSHNLTEHTPIAIFVNGSMDAQVDGRAVKFYSFPQGQGTGVVADGLWTIDDLRAVLDRAIGR